MATKKTAKKAAPPARKSAAKPAAKKAAKPASKAAAKKATPAKKAPAKPAPKASKPVAKPVVKKAVPARKAAPVAKVPAKKPAAKSAPAPRAVEAVAVRKPAVATKSPEKKTPAPAQRPTAQAAATGGANERPTRSGSTGNATGAVKSGTATTAKNAARSSPQVESMTRTTQKKSAAAATATGNGGAMPAPPVQRPTGKVAVAVAANRGGSPAVVRPRHVPKYATEEGTGRPIVPDGYKPGADEEYMNPLQLEYFRQRLLHWRGDLVEESKQTIENLREEVRDVGDEAERATRETENSLELRTRDRYRKLISKIDSTLKRIDSGDYGFCVDTGEEIGLERLDARLTAERTIDAQERWEHLQKQMGD
ncbi:RNA polymerase-binding protein DksA [Cognatilysobacter lacus]|uniref:RNA polymerase-binding transcription factor DksA n=1 Tax=Cognatilysobacter lacus TaxID=1643323 RepID=A0A5D8Z862_9GAMM|nr:RNA polymerase-binding protein DksA [Lysobacter lacus]TZF91115.1 RNA polymerase-binding protein DksA [Lysobacter lacus]